jgi:pyruvate/2-oxoacid:ferredoxin oxidoreductase alpha subunit
LADCLISRTGLIIDSLALVLSFTQIVHDLLHFVYQSGVASQILNVLVGDDEESVVFLRDEQNEIVAADADWAAISGRSSGGLLQVEGDPDAEIAILTLGSVHGTLADARELHPELGPVKLIRLRSFRPFPTAALLQACAGLTDLVVLERALSPGGGGIVGVEVKAALLGLPNPPRVHNFAVGLGGTGRGTGTSLATV